MVLNADEYGNLLASVDPECDGKPVEEIQDLAADDFERYNDAITDDGLTEVGLRMLIDYKGLDVDKAYLNLLVRQSEVRLKLTYIALLLNFKMKHPMTVFLFPYFGGNRKLTRNCLDCKSLKLLLKPSISTFYYNVGCIHCPYQSKDRRQRAHFTPSAIMCEFVC